MDRYPVVTYSIRRLIESLVQLETANSVQCPWTDPELWTVLIREQQSRSKKKDLSPRKPFFFWSKQWALASQSKRIGR
jgi:predicted ATPase